MGGTITNQASVDATQDDDNPADNADTEETTVQTGTGGYPRPKGATPIYASLVPSYVQCTTGNRIHGPPLVFPSCAPPGQQSGSVTVGTPDANGRAANSIGFMRFVVVPGDLTTTADEADVNVTLNITDVRRKSDLADYTGEVLGRFDVRITDRWNAIPPAGATTPPRSSTSHGPPRTSLRAPLPRIPASAVPAPMTTSFDAIVPGAIKEGKRAIWGLSQVWVEDGGTDGVMSTTPNTVFARQGVFVP